MTKEKRFNKFIEKHPKSAGTVFKAKIGLCMFGMCAISFFIGRYNATLTKL